MANAPFNIYVFQFPDGTEGKKESYSVDIQHAWAMCYRERGGRWRVSRIDEQPRQLAGYVACRATRVNL